MNLKNAFKAGLRDAKPTMKNKPTPTATRRRTTSNGVALVIESYPREIRSSTRHDSKVTAHDFATIYTTIALDTINDPLTLIEPFSLDDRDADHWAMSDLTGLLYAMNCYDALAAIWGDIQETRAELQSLKGA